MLQAAWYHLIDTPTLLTAALQRTKTLLLARRVSLGAFVGGPRAGRDLRVKAVIFLRGFDAEVLLNMARMAHKLR